MYTSSSTTTSWFDDFAFTIFIFSLLLTGQGQGLHLVYNVLLGIRFKMFYKYNMNVFQYF